MRTSRRGFLGACAYTSAAWLGLTTGCLDQLGLGDDWSSFRRDERNTGFAQSDAPNLELGVRTEVGAVVSSPSVTGGTVYLGNNDGEVLAVETSNIVDEMEESGGAFQGTATVPKQIEWIRSLDTQIFSSPAVRGGKLFVGDRGGTVYGFNADNGETSWEADTQPVNSSPTVAEGTVYIGDNAGTVYAFNSETGDTQWTYSTDGEVWSTPAVGEETVYVGSADSTVYALDAETGEEVWTHDASGSVYSSPSFRRPRDEDGGEDTSSTIYVGDLGGNVYALSPDDGEPEWSYTAGGEVFSSPAVADGRVYVGSRDGVIHGIDIETGEADWTYDAGSEINSSPAYAGARVLFGDESGVFHSVNALTGDPIATHETDGRIVSSPAVVDGVAYFGSEDGHLYAV